MRRYIATAAGIKQSAFPSHATLSFAKVAEYQKRGAIHFHAVVRIDGPDGPISPPPLWATTELLDDALRSTAESIWVQSPYSAATGERVVRWGEEMDAHPIRTEEFCGRTSVTDSAVAAYVAKYISKSVGDAGGVDYPITDYASIRLTSVSRHVRALMSTCWRLGGLTEFKHLNLRRWAHTLGYRGHALTKSRRYSTTYGELRAVRTAYMSGEKIPAPNAPDEVLTESSWRYVGSGHTPAEAEIAASIAEDISSSRDLYRDYVLSGGLQ